VRVETGGRRDGVGLGVAVGIRGVAVGGGVGDGVGSQVVFGQASVPVDGPSVLFVGTEADVTESSFFAAMGAEVTASASDG